MYRRARIQLGANLEMAVLVYLFGTNTEYELYEDRVLLPNGPIKDPLLSRIYCSLLVDTKQEYEQPVRYI